MLFCPTEFITYLELVITVLSLLKIVIELTA